jgi:hypothetical protein
MPLFRRVMLISALVLGSHAMHHTFAVLRWSAAGVSPAMASALWSESVAAEVVVFFLIGPPLLTHLQPARVLTIAATAGVVRWVAMASSTSVLALALVQPLHGLTFAALNLACMRLIPAIVPQRLAATAQAMYALGAGATTALLTLASGWLYATLGAQRIPGDGARLCRGPPADLETACRSLRVSSSRGDVVLDSTEILCGPTLQGRRDELKHVAVWIFKVQISITILLVRLRPLQNRDPLRLEKLGRSVDLVRRTQT